MALKVEKGSEYKVYRLRSGESQAGPWELFVIKSSTKKFRQEITVFPDMVPSGVKEGGYCRIQDILCVSMKQAKNKEGLWSGINVAITARVVPSEGLEVDDDDILDTL